MKQKLVAKGTRAQNKSDETAGLPVTWSTASFWHSEPNSFLLGHRTTQELPREADIVIVGSGITGASIARYLAEDDRAQGKSILMLDAREVCWGATGRNGGHCQPLLLHRTAEVAEFEIKNVAEVRSYIEKHDIDCEWRTVVACRTIWSQETYESTMALINELRRTDPDIGRLIEFSNDQEVFQKNRVKSACKGITLTHGAGQLWPYKYVTAIVERMTKDHGLNLQTNTPVTSIRNGVVQTPRGDVKAGNIILATNGYTSHLLPEFADLIVPFRCEMSALVPPTKERLANSYGMVGFQNGRPDYDDYLIQRPFDDDGRGGHLMFGGGRGDALYNCLGETDDGIVDTGEAAYLRRNLPKMLELGRNGELQASHQWTGIKGVSRDHNPWVGRVKDNVWLCGGYTGHGMPNATLCGKAVVDMLLGGADSPQKLIESKQLPASYLITEDRLKAARKLRTVLEQDSLGLI